MIDISLERVKADLRMTHAFDDALLLDHIAGAKDEARLFMGRARLPIVDSEGRLLPDDSQEVGDIAPSVYPAICLLVRAKYEAVDGAEVQSLRRAAESLLMPYRKGLGV